MILERITYLSVCILSILLCVSQMKKAHCEWSHFVNSEFQVYKFAVTNQEELVSLFKCGALSGKNSDSKIEIYSPKHLRSIQNFKFETLKSSGSKFIDYTEFKDIDKVPSYNQNKKFIKDLINTNDPKKKLSKLISNFNQS